MSPDNGFSSVCRDGCACSGGSTDGVTEYGARCQFSAWANPLQAGHLGMLAESTSGILFPQMATVLPFVILASVNDGKWWVGGRETNFFVAISF